LIHIAEVSRDHISIRTFLWHVAVELYDRTCREVRSDFRIKRRRAARADVCLDHIVQARVTNHHHVLVPLSQHRGAIARMRMTVDDCLNRLFAERPDRLEIEFTIVLAVARIKGNEAIVRIDNRHRREAITAEYPDPLGRFFDRRFDPIKIANSPQQLLLNNSLLVIAPFGALAMATGAPM